MYINNTIMKKATMMILAAAAIVSCAPKGAPQLGKDSLDKVIASSATRSFSWSAALPAERCGC